MAIAPNMPYPDPGDPITAIKAPQAAAPAMPATSAAKYRFQPDTISPSSRLRVSDGSKAWSLIRGFVGRLEEIGRTYQYICSLPHSFYEAAKSVFQDDTNAGWRGNLAWRRALLGKRVSGLLSRLLRISGDLNSLSTTS